MRTNAEESPLDNTEFTGENFDALVKFLRDSFYMEFMQNGGSLFINSGIDLAESIDMEATRSRSGDIVAYQIWAREMFKPTDACRRVLLHPAVRLNSTFADIDMEVRENILFSPATILEFLQTNATLPDNVIPLPSADSLENHPLLNQSGFTVENLTPICPYSGFLDFNAADRIDLLDDTMGELEKECHDHPNSKLAIGCERGKPWMLRMYRLTFQPAAYFISRMFPDDKSKPDNVTIDHTFKPNEQAGFEAEPREDVALNLQSWNDFTDTDVESIRNLIVDAAENNDVWVLCRNAANNKGTIIISVYLRPHAE